MDLMLGQGAAAYELLEQEPHLDAILCSVSCGGLISGMAVYCKSVSQAFAEVLCSGAGWLEVGNVFEDKYKKLEWWL